VKQVSISEKTSFVSVIYELLYANASTTILHPSIFAPFKQSCLHILVVLRFWIPMYAL
jgi:hypothetical protein